VARSSRMDLSPARRVGRGAERTEDEDDNGNGHTRGGFSASSSPQRSPLNVRGIRAPTESDAADVQRARDEVDGTVRAIRGAGQRSRRYRASLTRAGGEAIVREIVGDAEEGDRGFREQQGGLDNDVGEIVSRVAEGLGPSSSAGGRGTQRAAGEQ